MRVRTRVQVSLSSSSTEERDLGYPLIDDINDTLGEGGTLKALVPAGTTDLVLPLGVVADAKYLFMITEAKDPNDTPGGITWKKNSPGNEETTIAPMGNTNKGVLLLSTTGITSLYVSNAGLIDMYIIYSVVGD